MILESAAVAYLRAVMDDDMGPKGDPLADFHTGAQQQPRPLGSVVIIAHVSSTCHARVDGACVSDPPGSTDAN